MVAGSTGARAGDYAVQIAQLQRADLDRLGGQVPAAEIAASLRTAVDLTTPLPLWLARIDSIPRPWRASAEREAVPYLTEDVLAGLHGHGVSPYLLIRGERQRVRLYLAAQSSAEGAALRALIGSQYPGIVLYPSQDLPATHSDSGLETAAQWRAVAAELQDLRNYLANCRHIGLVTGIPTPRPAPMEGQGTQIDRLMRGLYGQDWALLVIAAPEQDAALVEMQLDLQREQIRVEQEEGFREQRERSGQSVAAYYYRLLDMQHQLLESCLYLGGWWVQVYICSTEPSTYQSARALVKSIMAGDYGRIDRIRVLDAPGAGRRVASFSPLLAERDQLFAQPAPFARPHTRYQTLLSSGQFAAWYHLPQTELPGYFVRESAEFDLSPHVPRDTPAVSLGTVLDRGRPSGVDYRVPLDDLTRHALVVGITGSGKTNTVFHALQQLQSQ
ncbi:MAG: hypothetical protein ACYCYF_06550, partial [Anaerolineae bacterium]